MDLQELVDRRIAELRYQSEPRVRAGSFPEHGGRAEFSSAADREHWERREALPPSIPPQTRRGHESGAADTSLLSTAPDAQQELSQFAEMVDASLAGMAGRMLEMTEQLAGDYARLEKNILRARLETLQTVESIMDIALSLRREARVRLDAIAGELRRQPAAAMEPALRPPAAGDTAGENPGGNGGHGSMHEGMAALFKRTL